MLLPEYQADGRKYHIPFSKIGITDAKAASVSFVRLVHVPTDSRSALVTEDRDGGDKTRDRLRQPPQLAANNPAWFLRNSRLSSFPLGVFGSASTNTTRFGALKDAMVVAQ